MSQDSLPSGQNVQTWRCPDFQLWRVEGCRQGGGGSPTGDLYERLAAGTSALPREPVTKVPQAAAPPGLRTRRACTAQNLKISETNKKQNTRKICYVKMKLGVTTEKFSLCAYQDDTANCNFF